MANLAKLEFVALDVSGENYLSWVLDAELHLNANGLGNAILEENTSSLQEQAKALIFLRHHIHEDLKSEYLTIKEPYTLWTQLKERFDHQKMVCLPTANYEWHNLRLQDYKSVQEYNSALFKISSKLILCGVKITDENMLEKTFSTFHPTNVLLQQQYRERGFKKYCDLISCLLVAEKNNELLFKNSQTRPSGSAPLPEINATNFQSNKRGHGRRRGRGRGRGNGRGHFRHNNSNKVSHQQWQYNRSSRGKGQAPPERASRENRGICHRCGMEGHWSRTCRTAKHLVDLYQASLKNKGKKVETNFVVPDPPHVDVTDFPGGSSGGNDLKEDEVFEWWEE